MAVAVSTPGRRPGGTGHVGGSTVRAVRGGAIALVVAVALGAVAAAASAQPGSPGGAAQGTEVGISSSTIRIGVIADVDNPASPGLFAGSPAAVQAFATYVNGTGGLAGRKLAVDFIDSHLSDSDARNAIIKACSQDFAIVGTAALFLNNVDDMVACKDQAGAATGLPNIPIVTTSLADQCSPVSYGVNPPQLDCSTKSLHPQTFRGNQGPVKYYLRKHKGLHGIFLYSNDIKAAAIGGLTLAKEAEGGGIKSDGEIGVSALATQSALTPVVQQLKSKSSNYAFNAGPASGMVALRKEATLQGVNPKSVIWDCASNCYDKRFIQQGGTDVEGNYLYLSALPFTEAKSNTALANYIKFTGADKVDGFGEYAWVASLLLRDSVNAIVKKGGNNALTRKALLAQLAATSAFDAGGMWGTTNIGQHSPTPCFIIMQVKNGQFRRVYPTKPGTFDCTKSNGISVKADLFTGANG
jgi:hypothetical protein